MKPRAVMPTSQAQKLTCEELAKAIEDAQKIKEAQHIVEL